MSKPTYAACIAELGATTHSGAYMKDQVWTFDTCILWYLHFWNVVASVSGEALWELSLAPIPSTELACHFIRSLNKSESLIVLLQGESNSCNDVTLGKSSQTQYI